MEVKKWLLGEVLENYDYLRKPLSSMQRETFKGEYPYYGAQGIIDYVAEYRCDGEYLLIAEDGENLSSRNVPIAQIAKGKYWVNNHAHVVRNNENADLRYICYLLNNSDIAGYVTGSAQPKLSQGNLNKIKIALPTLPTQQKIASILSTYDTLIENNTKRIRLLEQMAENLYKEWFVRFHFPGHENVEMENGLPKGWYHSKFGDLSPIVTGKKDANFASPAGKYKFFTCSKDDLSADSYSFDCFAIILAGNGDLNVKLYKGQFEAYQRTYVLSPYYLEHIYIAYFTIRFELDRLLAGAAGAVIKFLTKGMIEGIKVLIPDIRTLSSFNEFMANNYELRQRLIMQTTLLARQRDLLLPRLMSGKLEVTV